MNTKVILLAAAFVSAAVASSCEKNVDSGTLETDNEISIFYSDLSSGYDASLKTMLERNLTENGRKFTGYDAGSSAESQKQQIKEAIEKGTDLIIVNTPYDASEKNAYTALELAKEKSIPIIFFGNEISDDLIAGYDKCVYVGSDKNAAAKLQGEMIGKHLIENFEESDLNGDGKISYILLRSADASPVSETYAAIGECNAILEANGLAPISYYDTQNQSEFLSSYDDGGLFGAAEAMMNTLMNEYSMENGNAIELVIAESDELALGAVSALKGAGMNMREAPVVPVYGIDAVEDAKAAILEGSMQGTLNIDAFETASVISAVAENYKSGRDKFDSVGDNNVLSGSKVFVPYTIYE